MRIPRATSRYRGVFLCSMKRGRMAVLTMCCCALGARLLCWTESTQSSPSLCNTSSGGSAACSSALLQASGLMRHLRTGLYFCAGSFLSHESHLWLMHAVNSWTYRGKKLLRLPFSGTTCLQTIHVFHLIQKSKLQHTRAYTVGMLILMLWVH